MAVFIMVVFTLLVRGTVLELRASLVTSLGHIPNKITALIAVLLLPLVALIVVRMVAAAFDSRGINCLLGHLISFGLGHVVHCRSNSCFR